MCVGRSTLIVRISAAEIAEIVLLDIALTFLHSLQLARGHASENRHLSGMIKRYLWSNDRFIALFHLQRTLHFCGAEAMINYLLANITCRLESDAQGIFDISSKIVMQMRRQIYKYELTIICVHPFEFFQLKALRKFVRKITKNTFEWFNG